MEISPTVEIQSEEFESVSQSFPPNSIENFLLENEFNLTTSSHNYDKQLNISMDTDNTITPYLQQVSQQPLLSTITN